ncbi:MAG TPA: terminase large subunit, partial [Microlunatus sp.]
MALRPVDDLGAVQEQLLSSLVLENGNRWGVAAESFQWGDARTVLADCTAPDAIRRTFWLRARGMSKSTDGAAIALALLLTCAPRGSHSYVWATDADQAEKLSEAMAGLVIRTGLTGLVDLGARTVTVRKSGASLSVESSDGASAFGARPWLSLVDEIGAWPSTANHRRLWSAIVSAVPKVPGSRLLVLSTAGSPTGIGAQVWKQAEASQFWRTSLNPGPAPWWPQSEIDSTRNDLTASDWRRLILCEWAEGDDALGTAEDVEACTRAGSAVLPYRLPAGPYVAALDVGTRRDNTALAIGHLERRAAGRTVIIDRVMTWKPPKGGRVDLAEVEEAVLGVCREYRAKLRFDRMQAEQLTANLARAGVRAEEYVFSTAGANRLAKSLYIALRDRAVELPDDGELTTELGTVRLVETGPGTIKLQNPSGTHDDAVTAVGMVIADLTAKEDTGRGHITVPGDV